MRRRGGGGGEEEEKEEGSRRGGGEESGGPRAWSTPAAWTRGVWASSLSSSTTGVSPSACPTPQPEPRRVSSHERGGGRGAGRRGHLENLAGEASEVEACREVGEQLAPRRLQRGAALRREQASRSRVGHEQARRSHAGARGSGGARAGMGKAARAGQRKGGLAGASEECDLWMWPASTHKSHSSEGKGREGVGLSGVVGVVAEEVDESGHAPRLQDLLGRRGVRRRWNGRERCCISGEPTPSPLRTKLVRRSVRDGGKPQQARNRGEKKS